MNEKKSTATPVINVTPLIDVLLVLLIIFMVISPARPSRFETKIPEKAPPGTEVKSDLSLVVSLNREGGYQLNSQPAATLAELDILLHQALDSRPESLRAAFIKAPRTLRYGEIVKVIDVMKAAGSAPIGMQLENLD
ncbi:MAG TPA: biopolymer transporter ExbD [Blastocatellia bacterium]|nr:biopolymer transporter ExbD [Blastocatellia bacterium]HMX24287.1 biopolymer transporter ExbD [Blastocatellia bacterium]HMY77075.1 biopolymer transporter ExbD [Blastocatellia bacterium]HMZ19442.1 biopolymer transporter ExbD [Blastocatellia bacterium]HNG28640.1 biopolymer transporter ExbD [Blastocatellia bacterium]